jgi:uncharacterized protein (DUF924 family)
MQWHYRRWMVHSQKLASQELSVSLSSRRGREARLRETKLILEKFGK